MTDKRRFHLSLLCGLVLASLGACATLAPHENVDRLFYADAVALSDLDATVADILARKNADTPVTILVKYRLTAPFAASAALAESQGNAIRNYLQEHHVTAPIHVSISPAHISPNQIWISYTADTKKGHGRVMASE